VQEVRWQGTNDDTRQFEALNAPTPPKKNQNNYRDNDYAWSQPGGLSLVIAFFLSER